MANGYARATRNTSVCLVSPGGGITNSVSGAAQALATATPTLVIATEEISLLEGMGISLAHSLDTQALMKPVTKLAMRVEPAERIGESLRTGFRVTRAGRRGPVYLGIPRDVLGKKAQASLFSPEQYRTDGRIRGDARDINKAAELLAAAHRPVILADDAVYWDNAQELLLELAELMGMPVIATENNKGIITEEHMLAMGVSSIHGSPPAIYALQNSDLILALGCNFGQFTTAGFGYKIISEKAKIIQVDPDASSLGKIYPMAAGIEGNIDSVIKDLMEELKARKAGHRPFTDSTWVKETAKKKEEWEKSIEPL
ncbi:MAG: thiamine pyrophosphate-binding protein, partial [Dehalococcoidia bacterium]|nr:thiamine pyrophosphate-binding protein [Dehalococcoidia bacterium]